MKNDKTYDYLARNDDGGKKPIGYTGLLFGVVVWVCVIIVFAQYLLEQLGLT